MNVCLVFRALQCRRPKQYGRACIEGKQRDDIIMVYYVSDKHKIKCHCVLLLWIRDEYASRDLYDYDGSTQHEITTCLLLQVGRVGVRNHINTVCFASVSLGSVTKKDGRAESQAETARDGRAESIYCHT